MGLERRQGSSISGSIRSLLEGNFAPAGAVMDWLQENRPEDLPFLRLLIGQLAATALGPDPETDDPVRPIRSSDWENFRQGILALFWFELYAPDGTWAALTEACGRMKDGPPTFGFTGT